MLNQIIIKKKQNNSSTIFEIELFEMLIKMSFSGFSFDWQSNYIDLGLKNVYNMYDTYRQNEQYKVI